MARVLITQKALCYGTTLNRLKYTVRFFGCRYHHARQKALTAAEGKNKMPKCSWCNEEITNPDIKTCKKNTVVSFPDGSQFPSLDYHLGESNGRCHDCNIEHGGKHHPGCDVERCPKCNGQLINCGCLDDDEDF